MMTLSIANLYQTVKTKGNSSCFETRDRALLLEKQSVSFEAIIQETAGQHGIEITNMNGSGVWVTFYEPTDSVDPASSRIMSVVTELMFNPAFQSSCRHTSLFHGLFSVGEGTTLVRMTEHWIGVINMLKSAKTDAKNITTADELTNFILAATKAKKLSVCEMYHSLLASLPTPQHSVLIPLIGLFVEASAGREILVDMCKCAKGECARGRTPKWMFKHKSEFNLSLVEKVWSKTASDKTWSETLHSFRPHLFTMVNTPLTVLPAFKPYYISPSRVQLAPSQSVFIKTKRGTAVTLESYSHVPFNASLVVLRACTQMEHDIWVSHIERNKTRTREACEALLIGLRKDVDDMEKSEFYSISASDEVSPATPYVPWDLPGNQLEVPELMEMYQDKNS